MAARLQATDGPQQTAIFEHPQRLFLCSYTSILVPRSSTPKALGCRSMSIMFHAVHLYLDELGCFVTCTLKGSCSLKRQAWTIALINLMILESATFQSNAVLRVMNWWDNFVTDCFKLASKSVRYTVKSNHTHPD
ncbi:hypothetical protein HOLleu_31750 [Holothuria leucospilota]|uniref:Uncharacterized protein n=1 Tax=Holothuria leucospilota TaxID=206669 RepID=A0A9Q1BHX5_HOLLE|nr:hypothetical protein HOLleu_31750 [Holothuria leucospilota]